ncbi:Aerobic cobaltochelatase subunit CobN [Cupriavidus laharis]|uniref:Aerobic cobaltochelatase subunit CobN n=1 Tax=Cupriavidus laharis TaxID=151654 RepID=A0ABN7YJM9_9BURK|nr:cobaltochelatase subunit CobN [Cupriavidus laharis]CAG9173674.1 Aerobic cobaltochelatase subunit CobN [Cupriavidus laharis]
MSPHLTTTRRRPQALALQWLLAAALLAMLFATQAHAAAPRIAVLTSSPVPAGKFGPLREMAEAQGMAFEARYLERMPAQDVAPFIAGADLLIVDAPRDHIVTAMLQTLGPLWTQSATPRVLIATDRYESHGVDDKLAARLHAYYVNGGRGNFAAMMRTLASQQFRLRDDSTIPAPVEFPKAAYYHPRLSGLITTSPDEALVASGTEGPVIGIAIHQAYVSGLDSAFIDDLIRRIEARHARALVFYGPVMDADGILRMAMPGGKRIVDVLVNGQIMLNPQGRKAEFETLDVPVMQVMPYRKGDAQAWASDPHGISLTDTPFYLVQPELAGVIDPMLAAATSKADGSIVSLPAQLDAVADKALNLARLRHLPNADKRVAILYYNYPAGEKNLSASFLNLPKSLASTLAALRAAGYTTEAADEARLQRDLGALQAPFYRSSRLEPLLDAGMAVWMPMPAYRRWYDAQPADFRAAVEKRWGAPEQSTMATTRNDETGFVIPRLQLGNIALMPVPPRGERSESDEKALYHSTSTPLNHFYMAAYLWARQDREALVHYGTHGTQEWTPGKERGLSVTDQPYLVLGSVPVVYPYIVDDVGEAIQAKRRGRAVIVSHQTPPFRPAGLHTELTALHDQLHKYLQQDEGAVKDTLRNDILARSAALHVFEDMGWTDARARTAFTVYLDALHTHLHELGAALQPYGLHTFGQSQEDGLRLYTVMAMLGKDWLRRVFPDEPEELFAVDYAQLAHTAPYAMLWRYVIDGAPLDELADKAQREDMQRARQLYASLDAAPENAGLLTALAGRHLVSGTGGDPVRNVDTLPTGRNLYGFDPSKVPSREAWKAGQAAAEAMIADWRARHGRYPAKLAFSLWSVETMRHQGMLEAQALAALGVRPKWDEGGRVVGVEAIPASELRRPRVDVVLSATGLYRDHFPNLMKWLAEAVKVAAAQPEPDNAVAAGTRALRERLVKLNVPADRIESLAVTRIFASESGNYGTGLNDATLATDTFGSGREADAKLANLYLSRMQYAYGPDEKHWGEALPQANLYAENLKGVEGALLARSSNLYGMLTTDDPFQYLGGIGLAVRHLTGKSPELLISNLRDANHARTETAAGFLANELRTRYFHPGWIEGMKAEGYSGALNILDTVNNFWGWTAVSPEIVRDDQWTEFAEVYVNDKHKLGLNEWFEQNAPQAQAQVIERMLEAARKGYWKADPKLLKTLAQRYEDLARRHDIASNNRSFNAYRKQQAQAAPDGFGLQARAAAPRPPAPAAPAKSAAPDAPAEPPKPAPPTQPVQGMQLVERKPPAAAIVPILSWLAGGIALAAAVIGGALSARRRYGVAGGNGWIPPRR